jgi:hypothetical protein
VERFLAVAGKAPNPVRAGALMNLYLLSEVERAEASPEFRDRASRSRSSKDKARGTLEWAKKAPVHVTGNLSLGILVGQYGDNLRDVLTVVRHDFTNYDKLMTLADSKFSSAVAKRVIRLRILRAVARRYSCLRGACADQWVMWGYSKEFPTQF